VFQVVFHTWRTLEIVQTAEKRKAPFSRASSSGAYRDRTGDLRLAKPALSQLS
jgi:hypothetical protein